MQFQLHNQLHPTIRVKGHCAHMLTREGFVAADMSTHPAFQRSSWKAEAIRRGDLKISGPIPITEDVPLNEEEERTFIQKDATVNFDQLNQVNKEPEQPSATLPHPKPFHSSPSIPEPASALRSNPVENYIPHAEGLSAPSPMMRQAESVQRESVLQSSAIASPTPPRSTPESSARAAQKRKRKSGLRNVFRKMFGRKNRGDIVHEEEEEEPVDTSYRGRSYHQNDSETLGHTSPADERMVAGPRISELPVEELQPLHPLGRQLPFPMNVNAPQASPPHDYLRFDRPRRASLPSILTTASHRYSMSESHGRFSTWEERIDDDPLPSPGIGIAFSSPTQATSVRHKRRSRSADALLDLAKDRGSNDRDQSVELRHWRASYMPESACSRPQTAKTIETVRSVQAQEPVIQEQSLESFAEMSATLVPADGPETPETEEPQQKGRPDIQAPVSAFNFGNLQGLPLIEKPQPENSMEISCLQSRRQPTVLDDDHKQQLENTYENLEGSVRRISTRNNRQTIILENAPNTLRTRNRSASRSISASRSRSATLSIHQEPVHQSSSDTLNPEISSPVLSQPNMSLVHDDHGDREVLKTMYEVIKHERAARKALEQQVRSLQRDISDLHALVNKLIASATATSPSYPTPSPDALVLGNDGERIATPRAEHYGTGKIDDRESMLSKFSRSETDSESGSDDRGSRRRISYDNFHTPDVWATPKEEGFTGELFDPERGEMFQ